MPTLEAKLGRIETELTQIDHRQRIRNYVLFAIAGIFAIGLVIVWQQGQDRDTATRDRIRQSCAQQNRAFSEYTDGLVRASGGNPNDPALKEKLAQLPMRDCSDEGNKLYFEHSPKPVVCKDDGTGFCVRPLVSTTTTTVARG